MTNEMRQAIALGRQLRRDNASLVEIGETIDEAFDRPEPKLRAFREAFIGRMQEQEIVL